MSRIRAGCWISLAVLAGLVFVLGHMPLGLLLSTIELPVEERLLGQEVYAIRLPKEVLVERRNWGVTLTVEDHRDQTGPVIEARLINESLSVAFVGSGQKLQLSCGYLDTLPQGKGLVRLHFAPAPGESEAAFRAQTLVIAGDRRFYLKAATVDERWNK